jgi:hypothetical protein
VAYTEQETSHAAPSLLKSKEDLKVGCLHPVACTRRILCFAKTSEGCANSGVIIISTKINIKKKLTKYLLTRN